MGVIMKYPREEEKMNPEVLFIIKNTLVCLIVVIAKLLSPWEDIEEGITAIDRSRKR